MSTRHAQAVVAVGVDDSREALTAARYAVDLARSRDVDLLVVCAFQVPEEAHIATDELIADLRSAAEQLTISVVSQLTVPTTMRVDTLVELATPAALLCRVAETAAVIVIGVHRFDLRDQLLTGHVASPVAAGAVCPVVVVPRDWGRSRTALNPVVVALDGETPASSVLEFTFAEAELSKSMVTALHAVPSTRDARYGIDPLSSIAEIVAGQQQDHPDIVVTIHLCSGPPDQAILDESWSAAMMVVGRPHRQRIGSWTRSVARAVLDVAHCPLVIVPHQHNVERPSRQPMFAATAGP